MRTGPQTVSRKEADIARAAADVYFLAIPHQGQGEARQAGRAAHAGAGSMVLVDSDHPFDLHFDAGFELLSLRIPKPLLDPFLASTVADTAPLGPREALRQAILDECTLSLADPDLTPHVVADRVGISVSYLTKLFAESGTTFGRWLQGQRLERAWDLLAPTQHTGSTITRIAPDCGFRDSAHFSRVFRARYGVSPRERRSGKTR